MMTSSNGNIFRVTSPLCGEFTGPGEFHTQKPVTRNFHVFFDLHLNKGLSKQLWGWWFETLSRPLWRQCNGISDAEPPFYTQCMQHNEECICNYENERAQNLTRWNETHPGTMKLPIHSHITAYQIEYETFLVNEKCSSSQLIVMKWYQTTKTDQRCMAISITLQFSIIDGFVIENFSAMPNVLKGKKVCVLYR